HSTLSSVHLTESATSQISPPSLHDALPISLLCSHAEFSHISYDRLQIFSAGIIVRMQEVLTFLFAHKAPEQLHHQLLTSVHCLIVDPALQIKYRTFQPLVPNADRYLPLCLRGADRGGSCRQYDLLFAAQLPLPEPSQLLDISGAEAGGKDHNIVWLQLHLSRVLIRGCGAACHLCEPPDV